MQREQTESAKHPWCFVQFEEKRADPAMPHVSAHFRVRKSRIDAGEKGQTRRSEVYIDLLWLLTDHVCSSSRFEFQHGHSSCGFCAPGPSMSEETDAF